MAHRRKARSERAKEPSSGETVAGAADEVGPRRSASGWAFLACLVLVVVAVLATYWPVRSHGAIPFDDPAYVTENEHVLAGLRWSGVRWAFTAVHAHNWHPLTWLSHMLDVELFGLELGASSPA